MTDKYPIMLIQARLHSSHICVRLELPGTQSCVNNDMHIFSDAYCSVPRRRVMKAALPTFLNTCVISRQRRSGMIVNKML
jgi:hypothetical protein